MVLKYDGKQGKWIIKDIMVRGGLGVKAGRQGSILEEVLDINKNRGMHCLEGVPELRAPGEEGLGHIE